MNGLLYELSVSVEDPVSSPPSTSVSRGQEVPIAETTTHLSYNQVPVLAVVGEDWDALDD